MTWGVVSCLFVMFALGVQLNLPFDFDCSEEEQSEGSIYPSVHACPSGY